jgi:hypothetical protein
MKRRPVNIFSACCLLLSLLVGGCGLLSLRDHRTLIHRRFDSKNNLRVNMVASCDAAIWLSTNTYRPQPGTTFSGLGWYFGPGSYVSTDRNGWRPYYFHHTGPSYDQRILILPHWLVATFFLALSFPFILSWRRHLRRRRRLERKQCPNCGYDLRATPDHCPECGQSINVAIVPSSNSISIPAKD